MPVVIPADVLQKAGLSERELLTELACRPFDIEKLDLWPTAQLAGLTRVEMESELRKRNIPIYRPTVEDLMVDLETLKHLRGEPCP
jgi:predicted HTH domain antitoxin